MIKLERIIDRINDNGDFIKLEGVDIILDALKRIFGIRRGTYFWDKEVGSDIVSYIYEFKDNLTIQDLKESISDTLYKYIPNCRVEQVEIYDSGEQDSLIVQITIYYKGQRKTAYYKIQEKNISLLDQ